MAVCAVDRRAVDPLGMRNLGDHFVAVDARPHLVVFNREPAVVRVNSRMIRVFGRRPWLVGVALQAGRVVAQVLG